MEYSNTDTSCSSLLGIDGIIQNDKVRYVRKGYGLIFACILAISYFAFGPVIMKYIFFILEGQSAQTKYCLLLITAHMATYIIANFMMFLIYRMKHPFFERYKILNKPWPWEKEPTKWSSKLKQVGKVWLVNASLGALLCVIETFVGIDVRTDYDSLPGSFELLWQVAFCMICEDTTFYWSHRFLHNPAIYPYIHKKHHEFYNTVSIAAEYSHPLEFIVGNVVPTFVGVKILGNKVHLATTTLWLFMRTLETVDGHCGYEFSWSPYRLLPLSGSSEYHNFHHAQNVGNFGSFFSYWDTFCGTNKDFFRYRVQKQTEYNLQKMRNAFEKTRPKEKTE